jgi:hypothetical protein
MTGAFDHGHLRRRAEVLWRRVTSGVVLLTPEAADVIEVTGPGAEIWDLLAEPITFGELTARLARDHESDAATVRRDVEPVLEELVARGAVEVVS